MIDLHRHSVTVPEDAESGASTVAQCLQETLELNWDAIRTWERAPIIDLRIEPYDLGNKVAVVCQLLPRAE